MKRLTFLASLFALASASSALADEPIAECSPIATSLRVDFPNSAQQWRRHGTATVGVTLNAQGHVASARIVDSSGHAALDGAALASARRYWRFDLSKCSSDLARNEFPIAVTFERSRGMPVYGTLNRKSVRRIKQLQADAKCQSNRGADDSTVFVCRNGHSAERLARTSVKE